MTFSLLIIVTEHKQYFLREVGLKARVDDESDSDMTTVLLVLPKLHQNKLTNNLNIFYLPKTNSKNSYTKINVSVLHETQQYYGWVFKQNIT